MKKEDPIEEQAEWYAREKRKYEERVGCNTSL
jgi:hypothetical protein